MQVFRFDEDKCAAIDMTVYNVIPRRLRDLVTPGAIVWDHTPEQGPTVWLVRWPDDRGALALAGGRYSDPIVFGTWIGEGDGALLESDAGGPVYNECGDLVSK